MVSVAARRLATNLFSNYAYVMLMGLITVFVVPLYVRALGPTHWGSVALCLTYQGVLFALEMVLGPVLLRDVARATVAGRQQGVYRRFLRYYGAIALAVFAIGQVAVSVVARSRLEAGAPLSADLVWALRLALVQFLFQFSNNAAIGFWSGEERQRHANLRLVWFALAKFGLALLLLRVWAADAVTYMIPFAVVSAIEFGLNCRLVSREQRRASQGPPVAGDAARRRAMSVDVAAFAVAGAVGLVTTQVDRIYLSFALPTEQFGVYVLVSSLILSFLSLQMPIQRAFLPRIATAARPRRVAVSMFAVVGAMIVAPCLLMSAAPELVLSLWLHNDALAAQGALPFRILLLAVALIALSGPSSLLLVHFHRNGAMAALAVATLGAQLSVLVVLTPSLGMTAGALAWLACGVFQAACAVLVWRWLPGG